MVSAMHAVRSRIMTPVAETVRGGKAEYGCANQHWDTRGGKARRKDQDKKNKRLAEWTGYAKEPIKTPPVCKKEALVKSSQRRSSGHSQRVSLWDLFNPRSSMRFAISFFLFLMKWYKFRNSSIFLVVVNAVPVAESKVLLS